MDKKIEDYLHLYLGCEIVYQGGIGFHILDEYRLSKIFAAKNFERWKPILRPLSDMKDEEKFGKPGKSQEYVDKEMFSFEHTRYLLSKHFDLFGLIEAGLAIDKTTLKP